MPKTMPPLSTTSISQQVKQFGIKKKPARYTQPVCVLPNCWSMIPGKTEQWGTASFKDAQGQKFAVSYSYSKDDDAYAEETVKVQRGSSSVARRESAQYTTANMVYATTGWVVAHADYNANGKYDPGEPLTSNGSKTSVKALNDIRARLIKEGFKI